MDFKNLKIIGTSHISKHSVIEIEKSIEELEPGIVTIELDKQRLHQLMNEDKNQKINYRSIRQVGLKGFVFAIIASWMSKKLGKLVGMTPGADMKHAVICASKQKIPIALIDQNIQITLKRLSKFMTWKEKWNFVADIFKGLILPKKQMKNYGLENFDLTKVPAEELISKILINVKKRYPTIYKVLIEERNEFMAKRLIKLMKKDPQMTIISVVGAGHKEGMLKYIKENWDKFDVVSTNKAL